MFKVFMCIAIPLLAIAWIAYWLWQRKLDQQEAEMPKHQTSSVRLQKTREEVSDWAQQMASFKKPTSESNNANGD
jgi:hypothetical protein